jgi:hypothetical protein
MYKCRQYKRSRVQNPSNHTNSQPNCVANKKGVSPLSKSNLRPGVIENPLPKSHQFLSTLPLYSLISILYGLEYARYAMYSLVLIVDASGWPAPPGNASAIFLNKFFTLYPAFAEVSIDKTPSSFARLSRSSVVT